MAASQSSEMVAPPSWSRRLMGCIGAKTLLYLEIPLVSLLGVLFLRKDETILSIGALEIKDIRAPRYMVQLLGLVFVVLLPWKYAYPDYLSHSKFLLAAGVSWLVISFLRLLAGQLTDDSLNDQNIPGGVPKAIVQSFFEFSLYSMLFGLFPWMYRRVIKRATNMILYAYIMIVYGAFSGILLHWKIPFLSNYAFTCLLPIFWGVIIHRESAERKISRDWGYVVLLGLMTLSVPPVLGVAMNVLLPSTSTVSDQVTMLVIWTVFSGGLRSFWGPITRRSLTPFLGPTFYFPLQLAVDIYDELLFIVSDYRSTGFVILLVGRVLINFLRNSGLWADFVNWMLARYWVRRSANIEPLDEENVARGSLIEEGNAYKDRILQQMHYLEQNSVTEALASITVLSAVLCDKLLEAAGVGQNSVNYNLTPAQVNDTLITYGIVGVAIFCTSVVSHALLVSRYDRQLYGVVAENNSNGNERKRVFVANLWKTLVARPPFCLLGKARSPFDLDSMMDSGVETKAVREAPSTRVKSDTVHPVSSGAEDIISSQKVAAYGSHHNLIPAPESTMLPNETSTESKAEEQDKVEEQDNSLEELNKESQTSDDFFHLLNDWRPTRIQDIWEEFFLYYVASVLYIVMANLFNALRLYQNMRRNWQ